MYHEYFFLILVYKQACKSILCTLSRRHMHDLVTSMLINNEWLKFSYPEKCICRGHPITNTRRHRGEAEVQLQPIHNPALGGGRSAPHSGYFIPRKDPSPIVQEAESFSGLVWMGTENHAHTGIWSLDHPACSKLLNQLHYVWPV
jgi:hypothetical protein